MTFRGVRAFPFVVALGSLSCGGSTAAPEAPRVASEKKPKAEARAAEPSPSRAGIECDDGSCFKCGDAVCLSGFYCSVGRSGRGCAWLPACAGKPTCACIASSLRSEPNCGCQEKEGGVYVVCDGAKL
jgi:hypothetical protein